VGFGNFYLRGEKGENSSKIEEGILQTFPPLAALQRLDVSPPFIEL